MPSPFVTNLDRPIFGLRQLPEVVQGALSARYSRSEKSPQRILLDEFLQSAEAGLEDWVGTEAGGAFYDRVLIGCGDDSVAELGGAHLDFAGTSDYGGVYSTNQEMCPSALAEGHISAGKIFRGDHLISQQRFPEHEQK